MTDFNEIELDKFEAEALQRIDALLESSINFAKEIAAKKHEARNDQEMVYDMLLVVAGMEMATRSTKEDLGSAIIGFAGQLLYRIGLTEVTLQ